MENNISLVVARNIFLVFIKARALRSLTLLIIAAAFVNATMLSRFPRLKYACLCLFASTFFLLFFPPL